MAFNTYARLELMGHRVLHGELSEEEIAGVQFIAIDIIEGGEKGVRREYYGASSVYCIAPLTEEATIEATKPHIRRIASASYFDDDDNCDFPEGL